MRLMTQKTTVKVDNANDKGKLAVAPTIEKIPPVDWAAFLAGMSRGKTVLEFGEGRTVFMQGDVADAVWYLQKGKVKHAVTSQQGKEAIVAVLGPGEFFGEGCLAGRPMRMATATTLSDCTLYKIDKQSDDSHASRTARDLGIVCHASADAQHAVPGGSCRPALQLQ